MVAILSTGADEGVCAERRLHYNLPESVLACSFWFEHAREATPQHRFLLSHTNCYYPTQQTMQLHENVSHNNHRQN